MKKIITAVVIAAALVSVMGCATKQVKESNYKGNAPVVAKSKIEIVDYQGASFGKPIPEWVLLVSDGQYSSSVLSQAMPDVKGKKVFVTIAEGDNYEFVKQWTDLVDVEVQVGDTMQRVVGKAVSASETATAKETGKEADPTEVERKLNLYKEAISTVEVNGLEKASSYWIEKRVTNDKKEIKDSFEYYAVWTMDQKKFDTQLDAAMKNVKDNTSQGEALKKVLSKKLSNLVISSNDKTVEDDADDQNIVIAE